MTNTELRGNDPEVTFSTVLQTGLAPILRLHCDGGEGGHEGQLRESGIYQPPEVQKRSRLASWPS